MVDHIIIDFWPQKDYNSAMSHHELSPAERNDALKAEFGSALGTNLSLQGVTPEELMKTTGRKKPTLDSWNRGDTLPDQDTFALILKLMPNLPEEDLVQLNELWNQVQAIKGTLRKRV